MTTEHRHYLTKEESELARKLGKSLADARFYSGDIEEYRVKEALGIMLDEMMKRSSIRIPKILTDGIKRIPERKPCWWHRKLWVNRWFPEFRGYSFGWYCQKCGEFKESRYYPHP